MSLNEHVRHSGWQIIVKKLLTDEDWDIKTELTISYVDKLNALDGYVNGEVRPVIYKLTNEDAILSKVIVTNFEASLNATNLHDKQLTFNIPIVN